MKTFIIILVAIILISTMLCGIVVLAVGEEFKDGNITFNFDDLKDFSFKLGKFETYEVNETLSIASQEISAISLKAVSSDIEVIIWDKDEIQVNLIGEISTRGGKPYLEKTSSEQSVSFNVKYPKNTISTFSSNLKLYLYIPKEYEKDISLTTVSGDICVDGFEKLGEIKATTISGDIFLKNILGKSILLSSVSGDFELSQLYFENTTISTTSGDIGFSGNAGDLIANSVSGNLDMKIFGSLHNLDIDSVSGNADIYIDENVAVKVKLSTVSGHLTTNIPALFTSSSKSKLSFIIGENPMTIINMSSVSGSLSLKTH